MVRKLCPPISGLRRATRWRAPQIATETTDLAADAQAGLSYVRKQREPRPDGKKKAASPLRLWHSMRPRRVHALDGGLLNEVSLSERAVIQGTTQTGIVPTLKREVGRQVVISGKEVSRWQSHADDAKAAPGAALVRKLPMVCFN